MSVSSCFVSVQSVDSLLLAPFSDDYMDIDMELSQYQTFGIFFIVLLIQDGEF